MQNNAKKKIMLLQLVFVNGKTDNSEQGIIYNI
jgi:hypothetical protein